MSLYSLYDKMPFTKDTARQAGKKRAETARRDKWGRFQPANDTVSLPEPTNHGVPGGLARARNAKRINGRFTK